MPRVTSPWRTLRRSNDGGGLTKRRSGALFCRLHAIEASGLKKTYLGALGRRPQRALDGVDLQVGQKVFAIGNPFGLDQTLTSGILSALGREIKSPNGRLISGVIQTDAAINPGNSGGPLLDSAGRLIGVNTAIASPSGAYAGVGFAIPVDTVNEVVTQLIRQGAMPRPETGIVPYDDAVARRIGVRKGVMIKAVRGAAAEAGLRPLRRVPGGFAGDVIVAINDQPVSQRSDIDKILAKAKVGETVTVTIVRDGDRSDVELQLREG